MATQTSVLGLTKPAGNENALVSVLNSDMDLIDAEAGKVRGNIAATYSASSSYAVGDLCIYNGVLYKCNTAIGSGGEAWNASHWTQVTIAGQLAGLSDHIGSLNIFTKAGQTTSTSGEDITIPNGTRFLFVFSDNGTSAAYTPMFIPFNVLKAQSSKSFIFQDTSSVGFAIKYKNDTQITVTVIGSRTAIVYAT